MRRVHVEHRVVDASSACWSDIASTFVRSFGWTPPPDWTSIDREGAIETLSSALMNDLVDDAPRMPFRDAEDRARAFVAECEADAVFLTNGAPEQTRMGFGRRSITSAKADAGVIAISTTDVRMMWIEDSGWTPSAPRRR